jgi:hypothetical protein
MPGVRDDGTSYRGDEEEEKYDLQKRIREAGY